MENLGGLIFLLCYAPIILPFLIGLIIFITFRKDRIGRLIGAFVFKPVIAYPLWFILVQKTTGVKILDNLFLILPGLALTLVITFFFRQLLLQNRIAWLFLVGDVVRWVNTWFIFRNGGNSSPDIQSPLLWFGLIYPSVYAIVALLTLMTRTSILSKNEQVNSAQ
jgi:hypothetical protein